MAFYPCLHLALSEVLCLLLLLLTVCSHGNPSKVFTAIHQGPESCWQTLDIRVGGKRQRNQENQEIHETEGCGVKTVRDSEEIRNPGS